MRKKARTFPNKQQVALNQLLIRRPLYERADVVYTEAPRAKETDHIVRKGTIVVEAAEANLDQQRLAHIQASDRSFKNFEFVALNVRFQQHRRLQPNYVDKGIEGSHVNSRGLSRKVVAAQKTRLIGVRPQIEASRLCAKCAVPNFDPGIRTCQFLERQSVFLEWIHQKIARTRKHAPAFPCPAPIEGADVNDCRGLEALRSRLLQRRPKSARTPLGVDNAYAEQTARVFASACCWLALLRSTTRSIPLDSDFNASASQGQYQEKDRRHTLHHETQTTGLRGSNDSVAWNEHQTEGNVGRRAHGHRHEELRRASER